MVVASLSLATPGLTSAASQSLQAQTPPSDLEAPATENPPLPDGLYLYGQSPKADEIGSAYMVFQVNRTQVVGAFYMPYSSFDCFRGEFQTNRLALTVVDSYEQTAHPFDVALQAGSTVASNNGTIAPVGLEGFHRIDTISENDHRILATCQADLAPQR